MLWVYMSFVMLQYSSAVCKEDGVGTLVREKTIMFDVTDCSFMMHCW